MDQPDRPGPRPVLVRRYAGQLLRAPAAGTYLTRDDFMTMIDDLSTPATSCVTTAATEDSRKLDSWRWALAALPTRLGLPSLGWIHVLTR
jgi:hypothetical protein